MPVLPRHLRFEKLAAAGCAKKINALYREISVDSKIIIFSFVFLIFFIFRPFFAMGEIHGVTALTLESKLENARGEPVDGSILSGKVVALYFRCGGGRGAPRARVAIHVWQCALVSRLPRVHTDSSRVLRGGERGVQNLRGAATPAVLWDAP